MGRTFKDAAKAKYRIHASDDDELVNTLKWMKEVGLVPKGTGKPTLPSKIPPFSVIHDSNQNLYYLVTDLGLCGDVWQISPDGSSEYVSSYSGNYRAKPGMHTYTNANFADYVELAVIQEVYGLLDPDFDEDESRHKTLH